MITKTCKDCGAQFQLEELPNTRNPYHAIITRMMQDYCWCDRCYEKEWNARHPKPRRRSWPAVCPELYRDTDPTRLDQMTLAKVMRWSFGANGLGLLGRSGRGKTRMIYRLLKREHEKGLQLMACTGTEFAYKVSDIERRRIFIDDCVDADILFLDDIDKAKFTDRVESDLMHVIEERTKRRRPIMFAVNAGGEELESMLSENRGEPIVRRLREFSQILVVGEPGRVAA